MSVRRPGALAVAVVLLTACSPGDDDGARATTTETTAETTTTTAEAPSYEPVFAARPCEDPVPDDPRIECGDLTVPADREAPGAGDVTLPVAILRSASADPAPDPIVYLSGGPGDFGLVAAARFLEQDLGGDRDVILFDQRGTGGSTPSLDCPEVAAAQVEAQAEAGPPAMEDDAVEAAHRECRDRIEAEGTDLDDFDTSATADDVEDLRVALGLGDWNVWGHSYGTTVALEVLRRHPEHVRAAVLDGVFPPDVGFGANRTAANARRAFEALFAGCAADTRCAAAHPDLDTEFRALVAEWDAEPFVVVATDPGGVERPFHVTGADVVAGAHDAMYETALIPLLPSLIPTLRARGDGAAGIVRPLLEQALRSSAEVAEAQNHSVNCADRARIETAPEPSVVDGDDLYDVFLVPDPTRVCEAWGVEPAPASFNEPVTSDVPTLLIAGEYDPTTPPADARRAAETLSRSAVVELPGAGHDTVVGTACGAALLRAFLTAPDPDGFDRSCVETLGPPQWAV